MTLIPQALGIIALAVLAAVALSEVRRSIRTERRARLNIGGAANG
jgi:hypothetical protein